MLPCQTRCRRVSRQTVDIERQKSKCDFPAAKAIGNSFVYISYCRRLMKSLNCCYQLTLTILLYMHNTV